MGWLKSASSDFKKMFLQVVAAWGKSFPLDLSWSPWKGCQQIIQFNTVSRSHVTPCTSPKLSATKVLLSPSPVLNLGVSQLPGAGTFRSGCGSLLRHCLRELRGGAVLFVGLAQHLPSPSGGYSLCIKDQQAVKTLAQHLALACKFWPILPLISYLKACGMFSAAARCRGLLQRGGRKEAGGGSERF